jgi:acetate kinase
MTKTILAGIVPIFGYGEVDKLVFPYFHVVCRIQHNDIVGILSSDSGFFAVSDEGGECNFDVLLT